MFNKQLKKNIEALDARIAELMNEIGVGGNDEEVFKEIEKLTELRCKLSETKVNESYSKEIISGAIGIAGLLLVMKYEESNVFTSKALNMLPKLFRG